MIPPRHAITPHSLPRPRPAVARSWRRQGVGGLVVMAGLYGAILWLSFVAYAAIVGHDLFWPVILGPVIISGLTAVLLTLDLALDPVWPFLARRWMWLSSATVRRWGCWRPARRRTARE